jgi:hypothetical protein
MIESPSDPIVAATKFFTDEGFVCGLCGENMIHPVSVEVNAGGSVTTISQEGTRMSSSTPCGRGVSIDLGFQCECGGCFSFAFQFHKGSTGFEARRIQPEMPPPATIWRD